jgi:CRP/FNR family cyclic AMP-dependent transcriptional regulator
MATKDDDRIDLLAGVNLFRGCNPKELAKVVSLTTEIKVEPRTVLCREGETGYDFFVILEGEATVTIGGREIATPGPGQFFGEMALLDGGPRIATIATVTPMRLLALSGPEFKGILGLIPGVAENLLAVIGSRLRATEAALYGAATPIGV